MDDAIETSTAGFWVRIRRRKVVQWGIAYVAGTWAFLQGLGYAGATFHWPEHVQQLSTLALLVGLPVVLVLAWFHGDRGEQRAGATEIGIITALLLGGGALLWLYDPVEEAPAPAAVVTPSPAIAAPAGDARPSIAVLPFENRSRLEDDAFFVDGIHDDILTQLAKIGAMRVIARTSVESFRDTKLTTREIAEKLGVSTLLEGGVQRAGDRVRVTVQLIDVSSDAHLWAENYDHELTVANIFAIQTDVATSIAAALKTVLTPQEKARAAAPPTQNLDAWEAYQLGQQRMAKRTAAGMLDAERFFRKAIELDPAFAQSYAGLGQVLAAQIEYNGRSREDVLPEAKRLVNQALNLNPAMADAWAAKGLIAWNESQVEEAEEFQRRAIDLNPNYALAHHWLAMLLGNQGRHVESLAMAERASALDPWSAIINSRLGAELEALGRFADAERRYERTVEIDPSFPLAYVDLAWLHAYALNRFTDAIPLMEKAAALDPQGPLVAPLALQLYLDLDDVARAGELVNMHRRRYPSDLNVAWGSAILSATLGDTAAAERDARAIMATWPRNPFPHFLVRNAALKRGDFRGARAQYARDYPELLGAGPPRIDAYNYTAAIDLVPVLRGTGESDRVRQLLDGSERVLGTQPRLGISGFGVCDVAIYALRGDKARALVALREAEQAGWRTAWRYTRDFDPNFESIRNEPEFKAVFADIERDIARQRAALAARSKDAPLDIGVTGT